MTVYKRRSPVQRRRQPTVSRVVGDRRDGRRHHEIAVAGVSVRTQPDRHDRLQRRGPVRRQGRQRPYRAVGDGWNGARHARTDRHNRRGTRSGIDPSDLTVFNGEVLFSGRDATGRRRELWVTNGTAAGTHELTASREFDITSSTRPIWRSMTAKCCSQGTNSSQLSRLVDDERQPRRGRRKSAPLPGRGPTYGLSPVDLAALTPSAAAAASFSRTPPGRPRSGK